MPGGVHARVVPLQNSAVVTISRVHPTSSASIGIPRLPCHRETSLPVVREFRVEGNFP